MKSESEILRQLRKDFDGTERELDGLYSKQGRGTQYNTKEARDKALKRQIKDMRTLIQNKKQDLQDRQDALGNARRETDDKKKELAKRQSDLSSAQESERSLLKALDEKKKNKGPLERKMTQARRMEQDKKDELEEVKKNLQTARQEFRKAMPRATSIGIRSLEETIVPRERLVRGQQYFGMLVENLRLKDRKYQTAVEAAAQNALFHVVVDSDTTAARLMNCLEAEKLGRVTFLPLNQLNVTPQQYPNTTDAVPLLETCIGYDEAVQKALHHVFDRKLLTKTPDLAAEWSKKCNMDAISLEGDSASGRGALTGGYVNPNNSKIRAFEAQKIAEQNHSDIRSQLQKLEVESRQAEQDVTNAHQDVTRLEHKQAQFKRRMVSLEQAVDETKLEAENSTANSRRTCCPRERRRTFAE